MYKNGLELFNSNIVKWYQFKNTNKIIQIGTNKYVTEYLEKIFEVVKVYENINDIEENVKYDYILVYGYENYSNIIGKITKILEDNGKILLIGNNDMGLNNWSKYCNNEEDGIQKLESYNKTIKTIRNIKREGNDNDFQEINTFYIFPDYRTAEVIVNSNFKIKKEYVEKYNPNINEKEIKIFDEMKVFKTVISNEPEMIEHFANSYFIELSKIKNKDDVKYVSFNNCRKEQYQLLTVIKENVVEKIPANEKAKLHIENMKKIIKEIKNKNINILDFEENNRLYSKLIKNEKTLDRYLSDYSDNLDEIIRILNEFKQELLKNSLKYEKCKEKIKFKDDEELLNNLNYLEKCYWDMVPKNCFYIDNKFVFFDQEWKKDYLPVEFLIYRSIINSYDLVRKINVDELFERLDILQYKQYFEKIDKELRDEIIDQKTYELMYKKQNLKGIDNLINDNKEYLSELKRKDEYIKGLEKYVEELKNDNVKKQQYIEILEKKSNKRKFF